MQACHELKSYISEGRKTVREIETETFEENPPLFREYISATPDMKLVMDNQLKNVKTHARLLSKGMWYDWRMTLLGTLKEGLFKTGEGMIKDEEILDQQQALLDTVLPKLIQEAEALQSQEADLQSAAEELASCDPEELSNARQDLITVDAEVEAKKRLIADMRKQLEGKQAELESGAERKQAWLEEIREAEKIREECRGWTSTEISALKGKSSFKTGIEPKLILFRQSGCNRERAWLDYHWSVRHHNLDDLPERHRTRFRRSLVPAQPREDRSHTARQLPHRSLVHRRKQRAGSSAPHSRERILPPKHPRPHPGSPTSTNTSQRTLKRRQH